VEAIGGGRPAPVVLHDFAVAKKKLEKSRQHLAFLDRVADSNQNLFRAAFH